MTNLLIWLSVIGFQGTGGEADARALVERAIEAMGGRDALHARNDVTYTYTYMDAQSGKKDVSTEVYLFDGELSWSEYLETDNALAAVEGRLVQGYDGESTWATIDGDPVTDPKALKRADFLRKTNYYWFAMMFKLRDPGLTYADKGTRTIEGIEYQMVQVGFEPNVGDAQDTYLLYINPYTHLVDQFLFTVMDFGRADPLLMKVQYAMVDGVLLPAVRRYAPSDWDGEVQGNEWTLEIMSHIRFDTGVSRSKFRKP